MAAAGGVQGRTRVARRKGKNKKRSRANRRAAVRQDTLSQAALRFDQMHAAETESVSAADAYRLSSWVYGAISSIAGTIAESIELEVLDRNDNPVRNGPLFNLIHRPNEYDQQNTSAETDPSDIGSRIDPVLARSWLLVNGAQYERFAPAARSRADIVVLDIEDAVAPKDKLAARENVVRWLGETSDDHPGGAGDWVRINGFGTPWWADDLDALAPTSIGGVMLAMVESVDHVTETAKRLPNVPIVALVETARGLERISEIATAKGTFRLAFGIGEFRRDPGFGGSPLTLAYARSGEIEMHRIAEEDPGSDTSDVI